MKVLSGRIMTEGDEIYYEARGQGIPLLMIPGAFGDGWWYSWVADLLSIEFKVITYDRRANARSTMNNPQNFEISQQCRDAVAVLQANNEKSAYVFGSSSDAIIALDMAKNHPQAVRAIIAHEPPTEGVPQRDLVLTNLNESLFSEITDKNSKYFISGGRPVFKGNIYILSNYRTGSAAAMLTTLFQDNGIGTVIGTSVGNNPIGATTYTPMELPKTKAKVSIATTFIERPKREKGAVQIPDIWIEYTINDLINGKDPYLETVLKEMKGKAGH